MGKFFFAPGGKKGEKRNYARDFFFPPRALKIFLRVFLEKGGGEQGRGDFLKKNIVSTFLKKNWPPTDWVIVLWGRIFFSFSKCMGKTGPPKGFL